MDFFVLDFLGIEMISGSISSNSLSSSSDSLNRFIWPSIADTCFSLDAPKSFLRNQANSALRLSLSFCCLAIVSLSVLIVVFNCIMVSLRSVCLLSLLLLLIS